MSSRSKYSRHASVSSRSSRIHSPQAKSPVRERQPSGAITYQDPPGLSSQLSALYSQLKSACPAQSLPNSPSARRRPQKKSPTKQQPGFPGYARTRRSSLRAAGGSSKEAASEGPVQVRSWEAHTSKTRLAKQFIEITAGTQHLSFAFRDEKFYSRLSHFYASPSRQDAQEEPRPPWRPCRPARGRPASAPSCITIVSVADCAGQAPFCGITYS